MLQDIRKNSQGTVAKVIVGLIVIAFAFFGIESILLGGGDNGIAEVNGEPITEPELLQAINNQKRQLMGMMGDALDQSMLDDDRLRPAAMESLVSRKLLVQSAQDLGLRVSERELSEVITRMEPFQIDGTFSEVRYREALAGAGFTPGLFKANMHNDLVVAQLSSGLVGSEFITPAEFSSSVAVLAEQRDLRYLTIPREKFLADGEPAEQEIQAWYDDHQSTYLSKESVDLDYLELRIDDYREPVTEEAIQEAFDLSRDNYEFKPRSRISHMLFTGDGELSASDVVVKAQELLSGGSLFAEVASQLSDDAGSASTGGDLGYTTGETFPEEMESVIEALEVGAVSGPVETDAGTHLLLVTERTEGKEAELDGELREQITQELQLTEARAELLRVADLLRDLIFNAEDFTTPARELGLEVQIVDGVTRTGREGLFASDALRKVAFSEEVLVARHNSEVIELSGEQFVAVRVRQHDKPVAQPLDEVRDQVKFAVVEDRANAKVTSEAVAAVRLIRDGGSVEEIAVNQGYDWQVELGMDRRSTSLPPAALTKVFVLPAPPEGGANSDYVLTAAGDAVVIELIRVAPGNIDSLADSERLQLSQGLVAQSGGLINAEFQRSLRARADITVR
jgi:peptidyl-prolyl cis-trans isomerase D